MRHLILASAALLAATPALAQEPAPALLPDTIVTATRLPTPQERVPASITVVTRRQLEERGQNTLAEALASVPGLRIAQSGGPGQSATVFIRGNSGRSVLVLLDGVPLNDPSEPNGAFNFGNDLLFDIERIEVLRGPASSLYGSAALGGVINLVSRRAADRPFAPYGELAGGTQGTLRGGLGATGTLGRFDYLASINGLRTDGFNATAGRFRNTLNERDGLAGFATHLRLGVTPWEGTRIEGTLRYRQNRFDLDSVPRDDPNFRGDDRRLFGQLRGETRLLDGRWTTGLRLAFTQDRRVFVNEPDVLSPAAGRDSYRGERLLLDWGNTLRLPALGVATDGALSFGVTYGREDARSRFGAAPFVTTVNAGQETVAGHVALQYRLWERLDVTAGLRHDAVGRFGGATTWRLGAVLDIPEIGGRLRASGGTGFNAPSLFQRFGVLPPFFAGNPNLRPERSIGFEIGGEIDIALAGRADFATLGLTYFQSRVRNLIQFSGGSLANLDRARLRGGEITLAVRPFDWLSGEFAWTITDARDARTNRPLARRPQHAITASARITPLPGLVITPQLEFTGRAIENAFASYRDDGSSFFTPRLNPSGTLLHITATYEVRPGITSFLEGRNLTNSRFEPANGFASPGRSLLVGTRFSL